MPKTFHILSIWIVTESFQGSYHCFYVTFQNTETQKFNNVSKNFKAKIFVLAGWGGKSKHHIIFAFIFYATKLYFVYNVNFVAFQSRSHSQFFVTPWTVAHQVPLSIGFSKQEYWSELPFPPPGDLPNPGTEPASLASPALAGGFFTTVPPGKPHMLHLGKIEGGRRRGRQRMRCWMASPTQWTWVWVDSGGWWWTGRPGLLWFIGSQRVGHDWATELNWSVKLGIT